VTKSILLRVPAKVDAQLKTAKKLQRRSKNTIVVTALEHYFTLPAELRLNPSKLKASTRRGK
jgi:hypothetical protein